MNTAQDLADSHEIQLIVKKFTSEYSELMVSRFMFGMKLKMYNFIQHKITLN